MVDQFNQPYPSNHGPVRELRKAALIGVFVGLFLLIFQPFGLDDWQTPDKSIKILGFGVVTFVITGFNFTIWPKLLPALFVEEGWTVRREILFITLNVLLIAVANRLYLEWLLGKGGDSGLSWTGMILVTFLISLFPVTGLVLLNYITQLKKYSQTAAQLPIHRPVQETWHPEHTAAAEPGQEIKATLTLIADNEKDQLVLLPDELLYIESSDNYCTVVYLKNGQPVKRLLRSSLSRLEKQIAQPPIVRCHRSYVINLNQVERVTGNAQGYKLHTAGGRFLIPVARQYNETLIAELKVL